MAIPAPIIDYVGYTSGRIVTPSDGVPLNLLIKKGTASVWTTLTTGAVSGQVIVLTEANLQVGTLYNIKWVSPSTSTESTITNFTTKSGNPSNSATVQTTLLDLPQAPGPITFDDPRSTSVICIHREPIAVSNSTTIHLVYRVWTQNDTNPWIEVSNAVTQHTSITVNDLIPATEYEFAYQAINDVGIVTGPLSRYVSNTALDVGEINPEPVKFGPIDVADGKDKIKVILPSLSPSADYQTLRFSISVNGPWTDVEAPRVENGNTITDAKRFLGNEEILLSGFTANTTYYFSAIALVGTTQYAGRIASYLTYPLLPSKPDKPSLSFIADNVIKSVLPIFPVASESTGITEYLTLERGIGTDVDSITWNQSWPRLNAQEELTDSALPLDTLLFYRVLAVNRSGFTPSDPVATDTFLTIPDECGPIEFKEVFGTNLSIRRNFDLPGNTATISLEMSSSVDGPWTEKAVRVLKDQSILINDLTISTKYWYRFVSNNRRGKFNGPIAGVTTDFSDDLTFFERPADLELISKTFSSVKVKLPDLPANTDGLSLWYSTSPTGPWTYWGGNTARYPGGTEVDIINLSVNTDYYFLAAAHSGTRIRNSNRLDVKTGITPPVWVMNPTVNIISKTELKVIFTKPSDAEFLYVLQSTDGSEYIKLATDVSNVTELLITGLNPDTPYCYKLRASNSGGSVESLVPTCTRTAKDPPSRPGVVLFDEVQATRLVVKRSFAFPARTEFLRLYIVNKDKVESESEITNTDRILVKGNITSDENQIAVQELTPINSTFYFQFSAWNSGGETFGPIAGINTSETETKLSPLKPESPTVFGEISNVFNLSRFRYHAAFIQSPAWAISVSRPVEGMELWMKVEEWPYTLSTFMPLFDEDGNTDPDAPLNPWYGFSEAIVLKELDRAKVYKFKVRAFNETNDTKQYSPFSDELTVDLVSKTCTVDFIQPNEDENVFFKTEIRFTVEDDSGFESPEILIRGSQP